MADIPRPEHPRPDFERKAWRNLNGEWEFAIDHGKSGLDRGWKSGVEFPMRINVPFCPESRLSGIGNTDFMEAVWYRRGFMVDESMRGKRLLLHFGAVDYDARVWVNGIEVVRHRGGYTPFSADITDAVRDDGENELVVYAQDDIRLGTQPLGKQSRRFDSHGCVYTRTTGIWQTVWLEAVPETHVSAITVWPDAPAGRVGLEIDVANPSHAVSLEVSILFGDHVVEVQRFGANSARNVVSLNVPNPRLWNPGKPFLYDLKISLLRGESVTDEVSSYFGFRDLRIEGDRILINGKSVFQRLILDQGFWPDGIYTSPSDDELKADIERSIAMGFNGARLHQKIFDPRTLYWADKLGYLVWGEFPIWGSNWRGDGRARENILREWHESVMRDRSHPSIVAWTPFNEAHSRNENHNPGFIRDIYDLTKTLDPTRPVVDNSGYTHVKTDIWDLHDYEQNPEEFAARYDVFGDSPSNDTLRRCDPDNEPPYTGQPVVMSEYGGTWWNPERAGEDAWGYGDRPKTEQEFIERFTALTETLLNNPHIAGLCYTQLTDVEQEVNGLYTYDRKPKFAPEIIRRVVSRKAAIEE